MITTAANHAMEPVHDRMPAIIPWGLLVPARDDLLLATLASKRVNTARSEGPGCWADDSARDDERLREALAMFPKAKPSA